MSQVKTNIKGATLPSGRKLKGGTVEAFQSDVEDVFAIENEDAFLFENAEPEGHKVLVVGNLEIDL